MDFAEWIREQATKTYTENGAVARNTTGDARLDLFATIGSLRRADPERIELLFAEAYQADPLFALKILFYARDIREGLGERRVFRILLQYLAEYHPQAVIANLDLIGVFGRFDDWYCLIGTGVEDEMWSAMKQQLEADLKNFQEGKSVSLLAKWIKTADSKNTETRKLGILTAQKLLQYLAEYHPQAVIANLDLIGVFGRFDDWYCLIGTGVEDEMWSAMKQQLEADLKNFQEGKSVSLLAKWIKTADSKNTETRKLGILTAQKLGYPVYNFKRIVRSLRKYIGVLEVKMSERKWEEIVYPEVSGRAMMIYRNAFRKHDEKRFNQYLAKALDGKEKIHAETLYPYDLVEKVLYGRQWNQVLEAQWRQLPDYVAQETNAIVIADVSGSMSGRPLATSIGLAIYFAERNRGAYHNLFMTFSQKPEFVSLRGETLLQKIKYVERTEWGMNTNLQAAFERVLETAMDHDVPPEEMPKALIVVSDMEIDRCGDRNWMFYDHMKEKYEYCGYQLPNIIFWNVDSRNDIFHADSRRKGVQLYSGQSVTTFQNLLNNIDSTPVKSMEKVIESERYACVRTGNAA